MVCRSQPPSLLGVGVAAALLLLLAATQAAAVDAGYKFAPRQSTPGNDLQCGQKTDAGQPQPFCEICEGMTALADACDENAACKGFDMRGGPYCGQLKAAAGQGKTQYTEGFSHYCKLGAAGNSCAGTYTVRRRASVEGHDVDCNAKTQTGKKLDVCEVRGAAAEVAAACNAAPNCKAFVKTRFDNGLLKTAASPTTYTEGATLYAKD